MFAMLDADERAQVCSTGDLTWQVDRVAGPAPPSGGRAMLMAKANGVRGWTALEPGLRAAQQLEREVRNYRGRTSAGGRMQVVTVRREDVLALREFGFTW